MKDPKHAMDAAMGIAAAVSWLDTTNKVLAAIASLCAIGWYVYRFQQDGGWTKLKAKLKGWL